MPCWAIRCRPPRFRATLHCRDLFAPVAARLAAGELPSALGCEEVALQVGEDWPDDLAEIIYLDHYGNAITGLRGKGLGGEARILVGGKLLPVAVTFADVAAGQAFGYVNSIGLVEIAVNRGRADRQLGLSIGDGATICRD
mgnify:FL=1